MLEVLDNMLVKSATSLIVIPVILIVLLVAVVLFLEEITRARKSIEANEPWKYWRYDAANPSKDPDVRQQVSMQYLGYLVIFLAVEPAVILLAILASAPANLLGGLLKIYGLFLAVYAPLLAYAINEARKVEAWMLE
jgi:NADH-quinone oxidoreductase subunit A